ncbi:hypothetical protein [Endozoicomonas sp. GU-1]|uniref:hypothetical protein n=1 Tax=Endozoicomonas sp. GU-1 TaxID=3009078 RepID=UPI0022B44CB4|nr:hypothetical protein [Endozoicomonas sp. GU-1]WBA82172.1 hypothetical protein O2T12_03145 [Endozoicomonas sp. GU-1]WBA85114.1 hypothetical protein O3276_17865 [Endozoicomonas sp. GU-1]
MENKIYKIAVVIIPLVLIQGCFTPGLSELEALCEKDAGEWYAYDEPVYVDGYFYDNPSDPTPESNYTEISSSGFEYVEVYKPKEHKHSDLEGTGYFRLYKAPKDDPSCSRAFQWQIELQTSDKRPFGREYCVAVKKIDQPESRYWKVIDAERRYLDHERNASIYRWEEKVLDRRENRKIASLIFYKLSPSLNHPIAYGTSIYCDGKYFINREYGVLKPTKYQ